MTTSVKTCEWDANQNLILQTSDGLKSIVFNVDSSEITFKNNSEESKIGIHDAIPEIINDTSSATTTNVLSAEACLNTFLQNGKVPTVINAEDEPSQTILTVYSSIASNSLYVSNSNIVKLNPADTTEKDIYTAAKSDAIYFLKSNIVKLNTDDEKVYTTSKCDELFALKTSIPEVIKSTETSSKTASDTNIYTAKASNSLYLPKTSIINETSSATTENTYSAKQVDSMIEAIETSAGSVKVSNENDEIISTGGTTYTTSASNSLYVKKTSVETGNSDDGTILSKVKANDTFIAKSSIKGSKVSDSTTDVYSTGAVNSFILTSVDSSKQSSSVKTVYSTNASDNLFMKISDLQKVDSTDTSEKNVYTTAKCDDLFVKKTSVETGNSDDGTILSKVKANDTFVAKTNILNSLDLLDSQTNVYSTSAVNNNFVKTNKIQTNVSATSSDSEVFSTAVINSYFVRKSDILTAETTSDINNKVYGCSYINNLKPKNNTVNMASTTLEISANSNAITDSTIIGFTETSGYNYNYDIQLVTKMDNVEVNNCFVQLVAGTDVFCGIISPTTSTENFMMKFNFITVGSGNRNFKLRIFNNSSNTVKLNSISTTDTNSYGRVIAFKN